MRIAKTDQTGQMPRLIRDLAGCTGHFVCVVMLQLIFNSIIPYANSTCKHLVPSIPNLIIANGVKPRSGAPQCGIRTGSTLFAFNTNMNT